METSKQEEKPELKHVVFSFIVYLLLVLSLHLFFRKLTQVLPSLMKMELSRPDRRLWAQRPTSNTRSRTGRDRKFM